MKLKNLLKENSGGVDISTAAWNALDNMSTGSEFKKAFDRLVSSIESDPRFSTNAAVHLQKLYDTLYKSIKKYE